MINDALISVPFNKSLECIDQTTASQIRHFPNSDGECVLVKDAPQDKGISLIYDLRCQEVGLIEIDIESHEGVIIDIAHGEHLDDLNGRAQIDGRNLLIDSQ